MTAKTTAFDCYLRNIQVRVMGFVARWFPFLIAVLALVGCGGSGGQMNDGAPGRDGKIQPGIEGGPYYGNGTCNQGLTCASNLCVRLPDASRLDAPIPDLPTAKPEIGPPDSVKDQGYVVDIPQKPDIAAEDKSIPDIVSIDSSAPDLGGTFDTGCKSSVECDDGHACTTDTCVMGSCKNTLDAKSCLIAGQCYSSGDLQPSNVCMKCNPTANNTSWTNNDGKACDDKIACTHTDKCFGGKCSGTSYTCSFGLSCATGICTGTGPAPGGCSFTIQAGKCLIPRLCYSDGDKAPTTNCHKCDSTKNKMAWTPVAAPGCVTSIAGSTQGVVDGPAGSAKFLSPSGVAVDSKGTILIADSQKVRSIAGGNVSTFAGSGTSGTSDGPVATAQFYQLIDIAVDSSGKVYVTDNNRVRMISGGKVSTVAGSLGPGYLDGPAAKAQFNGLRGIAIDGAGKIYIADRGNHRIRVISGGQVSTLAGSGPSLPSTGGFFDGPASSARFSFPWGVAVDAAGVVYVTDFNNYRIRKIASGQVSTLAGNGTKGTADGSASAAQFNSPMGIDLDSSGKVYVVEWDASMVRTISSGVVATLVGKAGKGYADGPFTTAKFYLPQGLDVSGSGGVYVVDRSNYRIRLVTP